MKQLLRFEAMSNKGKTKKFRVISNHSGDILGIVHWRSGWRCYVMSYYDDIDMSLSCNKELNAFMEILERLKKQQIEDTSKDLPSTNDKKEVKGKFKEARRNDYNYKGGAKMVIVDFTGMYLNAENSKDNDICTIVGEGENSTKKNLKGQEYSQPNVPVELNTKKYIYSPDMKTGKALVKAWGADTKNWIGKQLRISHVKYLSYGQTKTKIECIPIEVKKV
jgi:hypothetical protein